MTRRRLIALAVGVFALPIGWLAWQFLKPEPVITWERAELIQPGMTRSEVDAIVGVPPGDYTGGANVVYVRGSVGEDQSGFYRGTNWWGLKGVIQVQFGE